MGMAVLPIASIVSPPDASQPGCRDEMSMTLNYRDQHSRDSTTATATELPGPFDHTITDEQLAELHRAGLAKEFTLHGTPERRTTVP